VARSQPAIIEAVGLRRKVTFSSTVSNASAYVARKRDGGVPAG